MMRASDRVLTVSPSQTTLGAMNFALSKFWPLVIWICVFVCTLAPLTTYDGYFFLAAFMLLSLGVMGSVMSLPARSSLYVLRSPFLFSLFAFWTVAFLSVITAQIPFISFIYFCLLSILPLSFIFVALAADKEIFFRTMPWIGAFIFAVLSFWCLTQYFFIPDMLRHGLTYHPFGNPNSLAAFLAMGFLGFTGYLMASEHKAHRVFIFALLFFIFMALLTTGSRGVLIALLVGFSLMFVLLSEQCKRHLKIYGLFAILCVAGFFVLSYGAGETNSQTPLDVLQETASGTMSLSGERFEIWHSTWQIIQDYFWLGTGVGSFVFIYPAYRAGDFGTSGHTAHNDLLQFWAEMGVLAPLFFYLVLFFAALKTFQILKNLAPNDRRRVQIVVPFCACVTLVLHSHISFNFYVMPSLFLCGAIVGYWFVKTESIMPSERWAITKGTFAENALVKFCALMLLLCGMFMLVSAQGSELWVDRAKAKMRAGDFEGFAEDINRAGQWSHEYNARALATAAGFHVRSISAGADYMPPQDILPLLLDAERLLEQAIQHNPYMASAYHERAVVTELALNYVPEAYKAHHDQNSPNVKALIEKSLSVDPLQAKTRVKLAELLLAEGKKEDAYVLMKEGMSWPYSPKDAHLYFRRLSTLALMHSDSEILNYSLSRIRGAEAKRARFQKKMEEQKNKAR